MTGLTNIVQVFTIIEPTVSIFETINSTRCALVPKSYHMSFQAVCLFLFRNGAYSTSPLLQTYCGYEMSYSPIISHGNHLYLKFSTDSSASGRGFSIHYDSAASGNTLEVRAEFYFISFSKACHNVAVIQTEF